MAESAPSRPPLALIANDQEWTMRSFESIFAQDGYAILRAYSGQQTLELARETAPDLLIIDAGLPDIPGIEVCEVLREDPRMHPGVPILITTAGRWTRQDRLDALSAGAWDYLGLPIDAEELLLRLRGHMNLKFEADRSREEGLVDRITGLYNLKGLMRRAREMGTDAYRHSRPLACVALALDSRERDQGDSHEASISRWTAVEHLAAVVKETGRVSDAIGRVRSGEFMVIAPGTGAVGALALAQRLIAEAERSDNGGDQPEAVAVLAGYDAVEDVRDSGVQPAALLAAATTALRQAQSEPNGPAIRRYEHKSKPEAD